MAKNKNIIDLIHKEYGLSMSESSFALDKLYGRHYLETDIPFRVMYYKINILESKVHHLYKVAKPADKKFFPPIELIVMFDIEDGEAKYLSETGILNQQSGNLIFGVYLDELKEKGVDVVAGDYVSVNLTGEKERFFEISVPDNVPDMSSRTIAGMKVFWKRIEATPVKGDVFPMTDVD